MEHALWTEKYRPKSFADFKGQEPILRSVQAMVQKKALGNLLFAGPAGVGKSTLALVLAHELFGDTWPQYFLELNASDERGIDVVRNTIKDFARTKALSGFLKIIFLDECDSLTKEAQQALRRTMENFSRSTRFILSCNYSSKIIDPIMSRCIVFRFKPLAGEHVTEMIRSVAKKENFTIDDAALAAILTLAEGDFRKVLNILQSCAAINTHLTEELIYSIASAAKPKEVRQVLETALRGQFPQARDLLLKTMLAHGLSGLDLIKQIQKEIWTLPIEDKHKLYLIDKCGEVEFRMVEGSDEFLQLEAFLANVPLS